MHKHKVEYKFFNIAESNLTLNLCINSCSVLKTDINKKELITVFIPMVCQKSLFQSINLKFAISVPVVSLS
ncbi:hypothetical protein Hanom_Chr11g00982611 [Helianthus anomalus]